MRPNDVLVRPTEKVSRTSATSGKNESRALIFYNKFCKVDPLQFQMMYYSYFYEQKLLQVVSIEKNAIDCTGASMSCALTSTLHTNYWCSAHLSRFNVKTLLYAWTVLVYL